MAKILSPHNQYFFELQKNSLYTICITIIFYSNIQLYQHFNFKILTSKIK